ncbi:chemotaxis response regulator protein-glutamate methylesterase [Halalkalibacter sp. MEB205]|uniref:Protein-glutamate methylesterase/protein-glutamine glutaminase n=2 Tax=Halalkalibacter alkaliphilus TaxID=2917993 RepID=A0A9X2CPR0_9BACI|nr:chemotaxis response regulator protein-glutamate methylesterase [Halalkalibacter alkaliphilus]
MRKVLSEMLNQHPRLQVVGTARNGEDALKKRATLCPDVITLDVEMPIMDGLETLKYIMDEDPCPVLMVSSTTKVGAENTLLAIEYGAVDFVAKPSGAISLDIKKVEHLIIEKVLQAAKANIRKPTLPTKEVKLHGVERTEVRMQSHKKKVIAIGTSTGGPRALKDVITNLPAQLAAPVLIVQHMPPGFTLSLAKRLNSLSEVNVKEAKDGEILQNGTAYIAPGGYHLTVKKIGSVFAVHTHQDEARRGHRPSVDVMFESLSSFPEVETIAVIMTGMGADGTEGLIKLKRSVPNCYAIAEAEESCTVFGMPRAAVQTKLVDESVHVQLISERILKRF